MSSMLAEQFDVLIDDNAQGMAYIDLFTQKERRQDAIRDRKRQSNHFDHCIIN